jgi:hypothetical protein
MTSAEILAKVNQITGRCETSIDAELLEALIEISQRAASLRETATGQTIAGQGYIDKPADALLINHVVIADVRYDPIDFETYLNGNVKGVSEWNDKIYIRPTPSSIASYTIYYRKRHPASVATILLGDEFIPAVKALVAEKVYDKYEIYAGRDKQEIIYERELAKIIQINPQTFVCTGRP